MQKEVTQKSIIVTRKRMVPLLYLIGYICMLAFLIVICGPGFSKNISVFSLVVLILSISIIFVISSAFWFIITRHLFARNPLMTITTQGVQFGTFPTLSRNVFLHWDEITNIYAVRLASQRYLAIRTKKFPQRYHLRIFNARIYLGATWSIKIPETYMKQSASEVIEQIRRFYADELRASSIQLNQSATK